MYVQEGLDSTFGLGMKLFPLAVGAGFLTAAPAKVPNRVLVIEAVGVPWCLLFGPVERLEVIQFSLGAVRRLCTAAHPAEVCDCIIQLSIYKYIYPSIRSTYLIPYTINR